MTPFKLAYRIAAAGSLVAAVGGVAGSALVDRWRRSRGAAPLPLTWRAGSALAAGCIYGIIYHVPLQRRHPTPNAVFLTFDDGPDPEVTPRILDALAESDSKATFFLIGEAVLRHPEIIRRMQQAGHTLAIHGFAHRSVAFQGPTTIELDLDRAREAIAGAAPGFQVHLYRPPYALRGPGLAIALRRKHLRMVLYTLDSQDYSTRSAPLIRQRVIQSLRPGDIVVLHDAGETGRATADALPAILQEIQHRGWSVGRL